MKRIKTQTGLSLPETTVVIAIVALLTALSLPATRSLFSSMAGTGDAQALISAALASARGIAAREQRYAGIRFQHAYHPDGTLKADQYIIFIIHDEPVNMGGLGNGFRAVKGVEPIKLSHNVGVMDFIFTAGNDRPGGPGTALDDPAIPGNQKDTWITSPLGTDVLGDITTFSIIFSPMGKMVIHGVRVRNRDGIVDDTIKTQVYSYDDVFNKIEQVYQRYAGAGIYDNPPGAGMFYQDDYFGSSWSPYPLQDLGLGPEPSRNSFVIYEKDKFKAAYDKNAPWSEYLYKLADEIMYISAYTGRIISRD